MLKNNMLKECYFCENYANSPHHIIPQHLFIIYRDFYSIKFNKNSPKNIKWLCKDCHRKLERLLPKMILRNNPFPVSYFPRYKNHH